MHLMSMKYTPSTHDVINRSSPAFATNFCNGIFPAMIRHRRRPKNRPPLNQFTTSLSEFDKDYTKYRGDDERDADARSQFGTKAYWDAMYEGMGEFSAVEYSWYYNGYDVIKPFLQEYVFDVAESTSTAVDKSQLSILIPGCGNDPLLLDFFNAGYRCLTAFDYSSGAIERQRELLDYLPMGSDLDKVELREEDARSLPVGWKEAFDIIIEKGALDAIYLSGDGNLEQSVKEIARVIKRGGICISCSGVVPEALRRESFGENEWEWLRDGSDDLRAGCFVLKRR
jgi:SAM-dependent methyltransferase